MHQWKNNISIVHTGYLITKHEQGEDGRAAGLQVLDGFAVYEPPDDLVKGELLSKSGGKVLRGNMHRPEQSWRNARHRYSRGTTLLASSPLGFTVKFSVPREFGRYQPQT